MNFINKIYQDKVFSMNQKRKNIEIVINQNGQI